MKLTAVLLAGCVVVALAPAQFIITEVHTGTPDFVEITNISGAAAPIAGIGIMTSNNALCPAYLPVACGGIAAHDGPYVSASAAVVPAGGTYIFEDLGVAGAAALTAPLAGLGEHTGFNMSWAGGSHLEVALYAAAAIAPGIITPCSPGGVPTIGGVALDYVVIQFDIALPNPGPGNPLADGYRYNPADVYPFGPPLGQWLSGPGTKAAGLDVNFRVSVGGVYSDTNSNADWNYAASVAGVLGTPGAPNPPGFAVPATQGCDLSFSMFAGPGSLLVQITTGNPIAPGAEFFTLIGTPQVCADGPILGLGYDVIPIFAVPAPSLIFHDFLSATGEYTIPIPGGVPMGIPLQARTVVNVTGTWFGAVASNHVYYIT
jgi:hypothetical protein